MTSMGYNCQASGCYTSLARVFFIHFNSERTQTTINPPFRIGRKRRVNFEFVAFEKKELIGYNIKVIDLRSNQDLKLIKPAFWYRHSSKQVI